MRRIKVIGITGGVGAGKSEILSYLAGLPGVRVVEADKVGHLIMEPGEKAFDALTQHYGSGILTPDGHIDRPRLSSIVFADSEELTWLNSVTHPAVREWIMREIDSEEAAGEIRLFVIEAALLLEEHYDEICDEIWYIYADENTRRERLKASRHYTDEKIDSVFSAQLPEETFREKCQRIIDNSGSLSESIEQTAQDLRELGILN